MTKYPLNSKESIEVPSLGFGPKWRRARRLLGELTQVRRLGFDPATPLEKLASLFGHWNGPTRRLEQENRLWQDLFKECQHLAGYSYKACRKLLKGSVTYAHRHEYEQILLYGEIPFDHQGLKKKSARASRRKKNASFWRNSWNACASWIAGFRRRGKSRKPIAASSSPETPGDCAPSCAFWIRRSRSPMTRPPGRCTPTSTKPKK